MAVGSRRRSPIGQPSARPSMTAAAMFPTLRPALRASRATEVLASDPVDRSLPRPLRARLRFENRQSRSRDLSIGRSPLRWRALAAGRRSVRPSTSHAGRSASRWLRSRERQNFKLLQLLRPCFDLLEMKCFRKVLALGSRRRSPIRPAVRSSVFEGRLSVRGISTGPAG